MKASLITLIRNIDELERQIACLDLQWKIIRRQPSLSNATVDPDLAELSNRVGTGIFRRQFEYNSIVVTLYGLFEQYIEGIAVAFLNRLNEVVPRYCDLHNNIKSNHLDLTTTLLAKPDLQKFRSTYNPANLVSNLNSCLTDGKKYQLNSEAFTYHTANFRVDVIDKFFSRIGIVNISQAVKSSPGFSRYLSNEYPERLSSGVTADVFQELNDLAERRNEVAHGSASEILSNVMSLEYLSFVKEYAIELAQIVISESLAYEVRFFGRDLGYPIIVYNKNIVCLKLEQVSVAVGDRILAKTNQGSSNFVGGVIESIQVNRISYSELTCQLPVEVALKVDFRAKDTFNYYLLEPSATPWSL